MNNTVNAFKSEINLTKGISKRILAVMEAQVQDLFVLNTVELEFDFSKKTVELFYYLVDKNYPNTILTFSKFKKVVLSK